jgi:hypothetical protein
MLVKEPEYRISWDELFLYRVTEFGELIYEGDRSKIVIHNPSLRAPTELEKS